VTRRPRILLAAVLLLATLVACSPSTPETSRVRLRLTQVGQLTLPGDGSRFDYASLDSGRGLLFIAHLGASEIIEVDVRTRRVVRVVHGIDHVHGVLVVPGLGRVYATATGANQLVAIDEATGAVLARADTGAYPDGLAYDSADGSIWTTNESAGTETVLDAGTLRTRGTVRLGDSVGNVAYDPLARRILVDVQSDNSVAAIDPTTLAVTHRMHLPGCDHAHGLALDPADRLAFVACDDNAVLLTVDLTGWRVTDTVRVGADPDVLSYDSAGRRLAVAAESGWVTVLDRAGARLHVVGRDHLADGAHVVTLDPTNHLAYLPVPQGLDGRPALLIEKVSA